MTDPQKAQIERINEISQLARTAWFSLLAYLVFVGITLLGVQDADFFLASRQTQLPLVGVQIPTASFFWIAPILGAALYTYLHLFLIKLWDAHGDAHTSDAAPTHHWLVNDFVLLRQGDGTARKRPLAWLIGFITVLLVWIAGPLVLTYAWWRSMPAHDEWMTLLIALCLGVTLYVGLTSWWAAGVRLQYPHAPWERPWHKWAFVLGAILLWVISWLRTEGGFEHYAGRALDAYATIVGADLWFEDIVVRDPDGSYFYDGEVAQRFQEKWIANQWFIPKTEWFTFSGLMWPFSAWLRYGGTWNPLALTDLAGGALGSPPDTWREFDYARRRYREAWCERRDIDVRACASFGDTQSPDSMASWAAWCNRNELLRETCATRSEALAADFREEWQEEREAYLFQLDDPNLIGRDLRRADLQNAFLADADLQMARLEGANLSEARLEGADLVGARLEGARLSGARLEGARLSGARLEGAYLNGARLEGAILNEARLDGAHLNVARLERANLIGARLEGANLVRTRLDGAILIYADLRRSEWDFGSSLASPVHFADFRGVQNLTQAQLENSIGNDGTLLPNGVSDTGEPWYVWSCLETPPPDLDRFVAQIHEFFFLVDAAWLRAEALCGHRPRRKVGTPLPLDAPYPDGHPLANRD